ncbi:hypothetical protein MAR_036671 [Mya arenaria]|uniref:Short-chain collagen C4-like n=1 Tax=Mya arenaria TaxID=6604 RepID=A0ABY7FLI9_MYAAR|nr:hypothetical protein MAR_036671 [Mya arenaria]
MLTLNDFCSILPSQIVNLQSTIVLMQSEQDKLVSKVQILEQSQQSTHGSLYIRWGRSSCPANTELVYHGFTAGKKYNAYGGGTNEQCLPNEPTWGRYDDAVAPFGGRIYGAEIDLNEATKYFPNNVNNQDIPCAVCKTHFALNLMIPARNNCYIGWTLEYSGFLMAGTFTSGSDGYNHICVDGNPEFLQHGGTDDNQNILYLVEAQCGSLPCPPYVQNRELACVSAQSNG